MLATDDPRRASSDSRAVLVARLCRGAYRLPRHGARASVNARRTRTTTTLLAPIRRDNRKFKATPRLADEPVRLVGGDGVASLQLKAIRSSEHHQSTCAIDATCVAVRSAEIVRRASQIELPGGGALRCLIEAIVSSGVG